MKQFISDTYHYIMSIVMIFPKDFISSFLAYADRKIYSYL